MVREYFCVSDGSGNPLKIRRLCRRIFKDCSGRSDPGRGKSQGEGHAQIII